MANYIYSTVQLIGEHEALERFIQAVEACTLKMQEEWGKDSDEADAAEVLAMLHINIRKYHIRTLYGTFTWWKDAHFDKNGKHVIFTEVSKWCRGEAMKALIAESNNQFQNYSYIWTSGNL
jgi:hypothetical protein